MMAKEENWHRRHAVMLASQLPDRTDDALLILRLATHLVTDFLAEPEPAQKSTPVVVRFGGHDGPEAA